MEQQIIENTLTEKKEIYPNVAEGFGVIGIMLLVTIFFIPIDILLDMFGNDEFSSLVMYIGLMGITFYIINRKRQRINGSKDKVFNLEIDSFRTIIVLVIVTIAFSIGFISPLTDLIPMPERWVKIFEKAFGSAGVLTFFSIVVAPSIFEELIMRGIILEGFLKRYSPLKSILISSFLFGFMHLNPWQFIAGMVAGIFMGWVYYRTRNLAYTIIIHAVNNGFAFFILWLGKREIITDTLMENYTESFTAIVCAIVIFIIGLLLLNRLLPKENCVTTRKV